MSYDTEEAQTILSRTHAKLDPDFHALDREKAAQELVDAVRDLARKERYDATSGPTVSARYPERVLIGLRGRHVCLDPNQGCPRLADVLDIGKVDYLVDWLQIPITYNPHSKVFRGNGDDDYHRNALTAVVDMLTSMLDKPGPGAPCWYADCYCYDAIGGTHNPVNSYGPLSTEDAITVIRNTLDRPQSGIDEIRVKRTTDGQNPRPTP